MVTHSTTLCEWIHFVVIWTFDGHKSTVLCLMWMVCIIMTTRRANEKKMGNIRHFLEHPDKSVYIRFYTENELRAIRMLSCGWYLSEMCSIQSMCIRKCAFEVDQNESFHSFDVCVWHNILECIHICSHATNTKLNNTTRHSNGRNINDITNYFVTTHCSVFLCIIGNGRSSPEKLCHTTKSKRKFS